MIKVNAGKKISETGRENVQREDRSDSLFKHFMGLL